MTAGTMLDRSRRIRVGVAGARSGEGPVTWGQWAIRSAMRDVEPDHHVFNLCLTGLLEQPVRLDTALGAVRDLLLLHDSLRTRILTGPDGGMRQRLDGDGAVEVHHFAAGGPDEVDAVESAVEAAWMGVPFDPGREWPVRVGLIGPGEEVAQLVLVLSHTASDAMGLRLLRADLAALLAGADPAGLRARRGFQPLDEAGYQASGKGRRRDAAARRYWQAGLATAPVHVFDPAGVGAGPRSFRRATLVSPALPPALDTLADRWNVPSAAVLLAAVSAAVAAESGRGQCVLQVMVSNRFIPSLRGILSPVTMEGLFVVDVDTDSFQVLARRAWQASIRTYYHSYYDKAALNHDLGRPGSPAADRTCWFNDLRELVPEAYPPALRHAPRPVPAGSSIEWSGPVDDQGEVSVAWHVHHRFDRLQVILTLDTARLDPAAGERMLANVEARIVGAANIRRGRP